mmetsp:Transcript_27701/g.58293  ORF Transcript_27701/g.58293 Transcript_27701/m.58293 type:complete len:88 (-) Transcript_27701:423-686(-)
MRSHDFWLRKGSIGTEAHMEAQSGRRVSEVGTRGLRKGGAVGFSVQLCQVKRVRHIRGFKWTPQNARHTAPKQSVLAPLKVCALMHV